MEAKLKPSSFKERLIFSSEKLKLDVPVRYKRIDSEKILGERFETVYKDREGQQVVRKYVDEMTGEERKRKLIVYRRDGTISHGEVITFIKDLKKGNEIAVDKSRYITYKEKLLPIQAMEEWLIEEVFEIWSEEFPASLYELAKLLHQTEQTALYQLSTGGKTYHAFLVPVFVNDGTKFGMIFKCARVKLLDHLNGVMEIGAKDTATLFKGVGVLEEI